MKRITVLIAEDHMIVRQGLRALLKLEDDIEVVGEAENGRQALEMAELLRPAVVVMDISMPLLNGLEATRMILQAMPSTKVLILSAHSDDTYIEQVVGIGAAGYLMKNSSARILAKAIREAHKGTHFFSATIFNRLNHHRQRAYNRGDLPPQKDILHLTSREREVLKLITQGKANKDVADELNVSIKTIDHHRQNIVEKLNIHDIATLTRYAVGAGIIKCSMNASIA